MGFKWVTRASVSRGLKSPHLKLTHSAKTASCEWWWCSRQAGRQQSSFFYTFVGTKDYKRCMQANTNIQSLPAWVSLNPSTLDCPVANWYRVRRLWHSGRSSLPNSKPSKASVLHLLICKIGGIYSGCWKMWYFHTSGLSMHKLILCAASSATC
jgi:hypothetical protein